MWIINLMNEGYLDIFFYNNPGSPIESFNLVYSFVFLEFSRFWQLSRPLNLLQFGEISRKFLDKTRTILRGKQAHMSQSVTQAPTEVCLCSAWLNLAVSLCLVCSLSEISSPSYHSEWSLPLCSTGKELIDELRCWIDGEIPRASAVDTGVSPESAALLVQRLSAVRRWIGCVFVRNYLSSGFLPASFDSHINW